MIIKSAHDGKDLNFDIPAAIYELENLIDGSTECLGKDGAISYVIRLLQHLQSRHQQDLD